MTDSPAPAPLRILSLGAGVQSTTVLLMALHGEFEHRLDCAIFADTGWEPRAVYEHLGWLESRSREGGIPVHRVSAGNLKQALLDAAAGKTNSVANPPFFVRNADAKGEYAPPPGRHALEKMYQRIHLRRLKLRRGFGWRGRLAP